MSELKRSAGRFSRPVRWAAGAVACLVLLAGCGDSRSPALPADASPPPSPKPYTGRSPYRIVTTAGMVSDLVREVAGDHGQVMGLMGEGVDPHLYKPTRNDVRQLMDADLVFYSGLMLEGRMSETFAQIGRTGKPVHAVTAGLDQASLLQPPGVRGHWDPHVWMDISAWSQCVQHVAEVLTQFDPPHAESYRQRAATYRARLKELDTYVRQAVSSIPEEQRVLVTAHDAFQYFSRAYHIPVRSIQGISTESEAGVNDINQLVDFLVQRKIRAVFVETSVSEKNIRAVLEGAHHKGWEVAIGGQLYSDAMGKAGTYEGTYLGMLDHNATTISRALGGNAPEQGWQGKLRKP